MRQFAIVLLLSVVTFAQTAHKHDIALDSNGKPAAGATIRVCQKSASGTVGACTPLANIYSDKALTTAKSNPVTADSLGNYDYYAQAGNYLIDVCYAGTCTRFTDYVSPSGSTPPGAWSLSPFVDDGSTSGIVGLYSPERPMTLIRLRVRGDRPWVGCSTSPIISVTIPQTPPAADLVAGSLTIQSAVVPNGGTARDNVLSASMVFSTPVVPTSEVVVSFTHSSGCSQRPTQVFTTLEFDGDR